MRFTNTGVVPITGSAMFSNENCSSISDNAGNLLFYTDGTRVWDKRDSIMPNGSGLLGWGDVQQGVLVVPLPGNSKIFYVFTIGNPTGPYTKELRYSIVDMTLNNSFGDITQKNVLLDTDVTEKLTATQHANGNAFWILEHPYKTNTFKSFLLNSNGLDTIPIVSLAGLNPWTLGSYAFAGAIKISNNGCWLISTIRETSQDIGKLELFHFDNSTGIVSGNSSIDFYAPYGLEFSSNSQKFYLGRNATSPIFQFDLTLGNDSVILQSCTPVSDTIPLATLSMQLGPDGKIYFVSASDSTLGAIRQPSQLGLTCDVNLHEVYFPDTISSSGTSLPNLFNLLYTGELTCSDETDIDNALLYSIKAHPNPFSNQLVFDVSDYKLTAVSVYNLFGQQIVKQVFTNSITINTEQLAEGIYFYELRNTQGIMNTGKIVKQ